MALTTGKYFVKFRHTDTALTPTFSMFKNATSLADVTPPAIFQVGATGVYYFSHVWDLISDPEYLCEVDGGAALPADSRYQAFTISPKDYEHVENGNNFSRVLGLLHENAVISETTISNGHITGATIRIYDTAAHATAADTVVGVVAAYTLLATYSDAGLLTSVTTKN